MIFTGVMMMSYCKMMLKVFLCIFLRVVLYGCNGSMKCWCEIVFSAL